MQCNTWPVAVCTWSLRTDVAGVVAAVRDLGLDHVNLALRPALADGGDEYLAVVRRQDWTISATTIGFPQEDYSTLESIRITGGIVPDEYWQRNRDIVFRAAGITEELGVRYLSLHAGFIEESDAARAKTIGDRMTQLADAAAERGIMLLMETGQETADNLKSFLEEVSHPALGVNLDPANMILYGKGDPVEAVHTLAPWIKHVHVKDAIRTKQPGTWGREVPWGEGDVGADRFLATLSAVGFAGVLAVERECGDDRLGDIRLAIRRLVEAGNRLQSGGTA
ncbi:MAG: sugar phosphate isomerase/epimerase family protein [Thermoguttaceae bacterium]|jgi:sugar phosphate isomerase/epimerase|nr:sugar phosphate isomerase/epimerase family protein [Thermoguttaceae bacterium]